jgi:hypothetical protein
MQAKATPGTKRSLSIVLTPIAIDTQNSLSAWEIILVESILLNPTLAVEALHWIHLPTEDH